MSRKPLRYMSPPEIVPAPAGRSIRTRLRVSERDVAVLMATGGLLGYLCNVDLAWAQELVPRKERKQRLTEFCSSRYAGAITAETDRRIASEKVNRERYIHATARAIRTIEDRLKAKPIDKTSPYKTPTIRGQKLARLNTLCQRAAILERAPLHIVRGGHRLWKSRSNLKEAGLTADQWQKQWDARRMFISALGSTAYPVGSARHNPWC